MGKQLSLTTSDQHQLGAYRAEPTGDDRIKGGIVVAQEIFGVNSHIRNICDRLAAAGYVAVAPALFDRFAREFECGYSPDEVAHARTFLGKIDWNKMLLDIEGIQPIRAIERQDGIALPAVVDDGCLGQAFSSRKANSE